MKTTYRLRLDKLSPEPWQSRCSSYDENWNMVDSADMEGLGVAGHVAPNDALAISHLPEFVRHTWELAFNKFQEDAGNVKSICRGTDLLQIEAHLNAIVLTPKPLQALISAGLVDVEEVL